MPKKTGNSSYLKEYNRSMLMTLVRNSNSISYTELSKISGLAPKSVYEIVDKLIDEGYLEEACLGESTGGRKPVMLSLKKNSYFSIGFDIEVNRIKLVLIDYTGDILHEDEIKIDDTDYDLYLERMGKMASFVIKKFKISKARLLGIGISVVGFINSSTKKIVMAPNLGWEDKDIINDLKNKLNFRIFLENEAMSSAVCEKWIGSCKDDKNFICINIMSGIGAGIYASDKQVRGDIGIAGEIGHITMDKNGPLCGCKNRGCLETFSSTTAILKKARKVFNKDIGLEELITLARHGEKHAFEIFETAADYLGTAICFLTNTLNPSKIVLGKDFTLYGDLMLDTLNESVKTKSLISKYNSVDITVSEFGEQASVLGAAMLPVIKVFKI